LADEWRYNAPIVAIKRFEYERKHLIDETNWISGVEEAQAKTGEGCEIVKDAQAHYQPMCVDYGFYDASINRLDQKCDREPVNIIDFRPNLRV